MNDKRAPIELRTAALDTVDDTKREIDLIVVPYDEWATVEVGGRTVEESFAPGAFNGIEEAVRHGGSRFHVNLEHRSEADVNPADRFRVGQVIALDPYDERGLHGTLKIRRTPEGDLALIDAKDGFYAASIGFGVTPENQEWTDNRSRRRILKAFLGHVALTASPAYSGANVLAVRSAAPQSATPNLDRILAERAERAYLHG